MPKFAYKDGERLPNPRCECPNRDKSKCFKIFRLKKKDDHFGKKGEFDGWLIDCPYFNEISASISSKINKVFSR